MANAQLITWLNDAFAMEHGLIPILQKHADDAEHELPEAAARIRQHITETRGHAERIEECLRELGGEASLLKSPMTSAMGIAAGMSLSANPARVPDLALKNAQADAAAEQFEIAFYKALALAATELGEPNVARACEENLREEQAMAQWLDQQLPTVVKHTLATTAGRR